MIQVEEEASDSSRDPADQTVTGNVQTVLSSASRQEIAEMVIEHLEDALLEEDGGSYSISEDETTETDTQYISC